MKTTTKLFQLWGAGASHDWIKAFITFVLSTLTGVIGDAIYVIVQSGSLDFSQMHWKQIGAAVILAVITYLQKQFMTGKEGKFLSNAPITPPEGKQ